MDLYETRQLISKYEIQPTRSLGQNFLIDDRVVSRLVSGVEITDEDFILEIGPGMGSLTRALTEAKVVTAIEIDKHMVAVLADTLLIFDNIRIVHADALKTDFASLAEGYSSVKVAANLPYYITTQLIEKLLIELTSAKLMLLMMQKEASERLFAQSGSKLYGPVSVLTALYGKAEKYQKVSASSYFPRPHVDSIVIRVVKTSESLSFGNALVPEFAELDLSSRQQFHHFLNACFSQRRKTLANVIKKSKYHYLVSNGVLPTVLKKHGLNDAARAEQLPPHVFLDLFSQLQ